MSSLGVFLNATKNTTLDLGFTAELVKRQQRPYQHHLHIVGFIHEFVPELLSLKSKRGKPQ